MGIEHIKPYTEYRWFTRNTDISGHQTQNHKVTGSRQSQCYHPITISNTYKLEQKINIISQQATKDAKNIDNNLVYHEDTQSYTEPNAPNLHGYRNSLPITNSVIYRSIRNSRNSFKLIKSKLVNTLDDGKVFYFSTLFANIEVDTNDKFIFQFTNHVSVIHVDLINTITKYLVQHLEKEHNITNEKLTFTKLRNILAQDFSKCPSPNISYYNSYFIRIGTKDNFFEVIPRIGIEEGDIFILINQIVANKQINPYVGWYGLLLIYAYGIEANQMEIEHSFKNIEVVDLNMFKEKNVIMSSEYISTTKHKKLVSQMKNVVEIIYERIINKNWFLAFKAFDTEKFSQYQSEKEVIIAPFSVFEVVSVEKKKQTDNVNDEAEYYHIKGFLKSNCFSDCINAKMSLQMQLGLATCVDIGNDIHEMYPNIILEDVASGTVTNKNSLKNNGINIGCMRNLRVGDIKNIELTDSEFLELIPYLSNHKHLNYLNFSMNNIGPESMEALGAIMKLFPYGEYLNCNQNNGSDKGAIELSKGGSCGYNLRSGSIVYNQIKHRGIEALSIQLAKFTHGKMLNLSTNFVFFEEMDTLVWALSQLKHLAYLNLSNNQISSDGLAMIGEILPDTIQHLNFSENEITQEGIFEFSANLYRCPNLVDLNLYGNKNGPDGTSALVNVLKYIPKLQILNGGCNYIGDGEGLLGTQNFEFIPNLLTLNLRENSISNNGMSHGLNNGFQLKILTTLDLGWNSINGDNLKSLADIIKNGKEFTSLNLDSNPIPINTLKLLLQELKEIDSNWNYSKGEFTRKIPNIKEMFAERYILQKTTQSKEVLNFSNGDDEQGKHELSHGEKYEHVKHLVLSRDKLKLDSLKIFVANFTVLSQLREGDGRCNEIGNEGGIVLSKGFKLIPFVENIILRENNIGDEGIKIFSENCKYLHSLRALNINWNNISDEGMIALSNASLDSLEVGKLKENMIKKKGMIEFSKRGDHFKKINHLDLGWNDIGEEGMKEFSENMFHGTELNFLLGSKNNIGDNGCIHFSSNLKKRRLTKLCTLLLWNNKIGDIGGDCLLSAIEEGESGSMLDLSINIMSEDVKQKYRDLGDKMKISVDI